MPGPGPRASSTKHVGQGKGSPDGSAKRKPRSSNVSTATKRVPLTGSHLLGADHIFNAGTASDGGGGGGGVVGAGLGILRSSGTGTDHGLAEQQLAALEQTLMAIHATNRPGLDGGPGERQGGSFEGADDQQGRKRAKAARAAAQTARMTADSIAPPPRQAGRVDVLPSPSPLLAFHDAADRRAMS